MTTLHALFRGRTIVEQVAARHALMPEQVIGRQRTKRMVAARHEAIARLRFELGWSSPRIGRFFGRDHTTILHALSKATAG